jgi:hypothetical protein
MQVHALGQFGVGADAHGHHHQIGRDSLPSLKRTARTRPVSSASSSWVGLHQELHAALGQRLLQHRPPSSSWRSISQSPTCTTVTCMPRFIRPLAASSPAGRRR